LQVILRRMAMEDVDQVAAMDRLSFSNPWPPRTYRYELMENPQSRLIVIEPGELPESQQGNGNGNGDRRHQPAWWERMFSDLLGGEDIPITLMGFAGMWHIASEAHISTIAVHPDWRGQKLGELLLWSLARQAIRQGAQLLTLEVRVSNSLAQNLYHKYGFKKTGIRHGYYRDNGEDAYQMTMPQLDGAFRENLILLGRALAMQLQVIDEV
jgi:ribosomal-protein-alanine N-acetyltransferase